MFGRGLSSLRRSIAVANQFGRGSSIRVAAAPRIGFTRTAPTAAATGQFRRSTHTNEQRESESESTADSSAARILSLGLVSAGALWWAYNQRARLDAVKKPAAEAVAPTAAPAPGDGGAAPAAPAKAAPPVLTAEQRAEREAVSEAAKKEAEAESRPKHQAFEFEDMKIFSGRANPSLALEIADNLGVELGKISIKSYADGEIGIQVNENVRGKDVYLIQPTCPPGVNDNLVELILMISTMRRASARRITAIIPYYGYARQDRKMQARVPISAADVARLLQSMGVDRVVAVDLHCGQIQGFFSPRTPCDNLEGHVVALPYFQKLGLKGESTIVVSPDAGGVYRAKHFRDGLKARGVDAGLAMIIKQRVRANEVGKMDLVGSVDGCDVIMVDDMIDTAGTLVAAANELKSHGAQRVFAFATHGVFSGEAYERIQKSELEKVVVCNTIPLKSNKPTEKIVQLSIGGMLSEAIARIHTKKSVSALFGQDNKKE